MLTRQFIAALLIASAPAVALADKCKLDCGRITEVHAFEKEGSGSGMGAVAGGFAGALLGNQVGGGSGKTLATVGGAAGGAYLGNMAEKKYKTEKMLRLTVKMDNGKSETFELKDKGKVKFADGDRVQVLNGKPQKYTGH